MSGINDPTANLSRDLLSKQTHLAAVTHQITTININIQALTHKFNIEANKIKAKLTRVQLSRPTGNPANYWPHRPMTNRINLFYQTKERKVSSLTQRQEMLTLTFEHNRAILLSQKLALNSEQSDIESQIKLIRIRLGLPINL